ncbi:hypothetical protein WMY93_023963 [Mugilogobius chulae]|uniref:Uncharacterized protein n=1 Tax=Mugilogobius chulae TaxID=88201 RepID=A0AAW0NFN2_9GOBI
MEPDEDEHDLEDQVEKWLTDDFSLTEFEDENLSELTEIKDHDLVSVLAFLFLAPCQRWVGRRRPCPGRGEALILSWEQGGAGPPTCSPVMDKYRPKRPTTLALFPQQPQAGSQDTINNNSLGKKDSWKDSHSSSPHITGDKTPPGAQPKAEAKVRPSTRRPAPKPPVTNGVNSRANGQPTAAATTDARTRVRERPGSTSASNQSPRSQRRAASGTGAGGKGAGRGGVRDRNQTDLKTKDGPGKDERRGARLCEEKCRDKDKNGHSRIRETIGMRGRAEAKTKANNMLNNHQPYLPAMVVPRTPVAPRKNDKSKEKGQNHDRKQEQAPTLSRSSSEGGSNRMSLSSDTEGPPPGPLHPSLSYNPNPDISEEDGEGEPTPSKNITQNCPEEKTKTKPELEQGTIEADQNSTTVTEDPGVVTENPGVVTEDPGVVTGTLVWSQRTLSETTAGLNYDSVKYTLVVDEHAQLELVSLKDCFHSYSEHKDDSDTETVYQSANEEEDPEYEVERKKKEEQTKKQERRKEEERKRKEEEDLQRRREEEVKRRREVVTTFYKHPKFRSTTTSEEDHAKRAKPLHRTAKSSSTFLEMTTITVKQGQALLECFLCFERSGTTTEPQSCLQVCSSPCG